MQQGWTRRQFLEIAGLAAAAQSTRTGHATPLQQPFTHAYVAVQHRDEPSGIQVLQAARGGWQQIQFVASVAPSVVLVSERRDLLFVANARRHFRGLPTASVESYRIDSRTRHLRYIATQRLGLASVMPHAMALSPDGSQLVVAAAAGLYNVLPVSQDGILGEVTAVRKELRLSQGSAALMHFVSDSHLQVQDDFGIRIYHCDQDGMSLLHASDLSTRAQRAESALLVPGQRSIALARFA